MKDLFSSYKHSLPVIYSHLEGQYPYVLSDDKMPFNILFTNFDYHYIVGDQPLVEEDLLSVMRKYIQSNKKEEFILFSPNQEWDDYLSKLFSYIGGVIDLRYSFELDDTEFNRIHSKYKLTHDVNLIKFKDEKSNQPYYQAEVYENGKRISYCRAFMVGKGHAELDVWTDVKHRYQGLAFETSLILINKLLEKKIIPNWTTWEAKKPSHTLAFKLGFKLKKKIRAFIWVNDFGEF